MTAVVAGLPAKRTFEQAYNLDAEAPYRLYFPEQSARLIVNNPLFKRVQETLAMQDDKVREVHAQQAQVHNIAVKAELPVNELSQLINALKPQEPSAASISLAEQARHDERARAEREQAELRALMEERLRDEKRQRIAAEAAARLAESERKDPVQNITLSLIHI